MCKSQQAFNQISKDLIINHLPFMVTSDDYLYVITDKATVTIKKNGSCILKTNRLNAVQVLQQNLQNSTRQIWTNDTVSNYGFDNVGTIIDDILKL